MTEQGPGTSPTEWARVFYSLETDDEGRMSIDLEGQSIPSLPGIQFAFRLTPGTTPEQAAKLVEMLEEHCPVFMAGFLDRLDDVGDDELMELYDDVGYLNPDRPRGPGDMIDRK
jgi:hypothetical protein